MAKIFISKVKNHEGECSPIWLNPGGHGFLGRVEGGITGFFKNVVKRRWFPGYKKIGEEFHGMIKWGTYIVESTEFEDN